MKYFTIKRILCALILVTMFVFPVGASGITTATSNTHWAGYEKTVGINGVSYIHAVFTVPTVKTTTPNTRSSAWIGIDGGDSSMVEQIGVEASTSTKGTPAYIAWYELYPAGIVQIPLKVSPGDEIDCTIEDVGSLMVLSMTDKTTHLGWGVGVDDKGFRYSTAEYIVEDCPVSGVTYPLTKITPVTFKNCELTLKPTTGKPVVSSIGVYSNNKINMVSGKNTLMSTSSLIKDAQFTCTWAKAV